MLMESEKNCILQRVKDEYAARNVSDQTETDAVYTCTRAELSYSDLTGSNQKKGLALGKVLKMRSRPARTIFLGIGNKCSDDGDGELEVLEEISDLNGTNLQISSTVESTRYIVPNNLNKHQIDEAHNGSLLSVPVNVNALELDLELRKSAGDSDLSGSVCSKRMSGSLNFNDDIEESRSAEPDRENLYRDSAGICGLTDRLSDVSETIFNQGVIENFTVPKNDISHSITTESTSCSRQCNVLLRCTITNRVLSHGC